LVNDETPVFIATGEIDDPGSFTCLFGGREELARIARGHDIVVPRAVLDGLMARKRTRLLGYGAVRESPFDAAVVRGLSFESVAAGMDEPIPFSVCEAGEGPCVGRGVVGAGGEAAPDCGAPVRGEAAAGSQAQAQALVASSIRRYLAEHPGCGPASLITDDPTLCDQFAGSGVTVFATLGEFLGELPNAKHNSPHGC